MLIRPTCYSSEAEASLNRHRMLGIGRDPKPGVSFGAAFRKTNTTLLFSRLFWLCCWAAMLCWCAEGGRASNLGPTTTRSCCCTHGRRTCREVDVPKQSGAARRGAAAKFHGLGQHSFDRSVQLPFSAGRVESRQIDWGRALSLKIKTRPSEPERERERQRERESERERR